MEYRTVTIKDYDGIYALWEQTEETRRAMNPVDDSRDGFIRYLKRNPETCFVCVEKERIVGVILAGHDGRRGIIHHLCVDPDFRRMGIGTKLLHLAEEALKKEGIYKIFELVFKDNEAANAFWEEQGYSLRTNINYRNRSMDPAIPKGE